MRLLIATGLYAPDIGGPATHTKLLEEGLPSHGIAVSVAPFSTFRRFPAGIRHALLFVRLFFGALRAQVILAQDAFSVGLPAMYVARLLRKPLIVRIPGDHAWEQARQRYGVVDSLDTFQKRTYTRPVERIRKIQRTVVRHATHVVVPSLYMKTIAEAWGVDPEKIIVIYNGVDLKEDPRLPNNVPQGLLLVTSARLVPWKGIEGVIDAVVRISGSTLTVIGDGPLKDDLIERARERGVLERVRFLGSLPHAEALGWYKSAQIFILNSSYEGFSHLLLEVMSQGTPIIATDAGGNPELVGDAGVIIPVGDSERLVTAIKMLVSDKDHALALGVRGKARVKNFASEKTVDAFATLIEGSQRVLE